MTQINASFPGFEIVGVPAGRGRVVGLPKEAPAIVIKQEEKKEQMEPVPLQSGISNVPFEKGGKLKYLRAVELYLQVQLTEVQREIQAMLQESVTNKEEEDEGR